MKFLVNTCRGICGGIGLLWSLFKTFWQLIFGVWRLSAVPQPRVSIFGGSHMTQDSEYAQQAYKLAEKLKERGISVITGGGPGIMEAANCGIHEMHHNGSRVHSIGIGVVGLSKFEPHNKCATHFFQTNYFFARKWLLTQYSAAFAIFPGGFGTLDELFEILTLMRTHEMPRVPIVLWGTAYWGPLLSWLRDVVYAQELVDMEGLELIEITDDLDDVVARLSRHCQGMKR